METNEGEFGMAVTWVTVAARKKYRVERDE